MDTKIYFKYKIGLILIHLNHIFPMKTSKFEISLLVESYDKKKSAENCRNGYVAEKRLVFKLLKI